MAVLERSLPGWIRRTSAGIPDDIRTAIPASLECEQEGTIDSVPVSCAPQTHLARLGRAGWVLAVLMTFATSVAAQAQFTYTNDNGQISITKYIGPAFRRLSAASTHSLSSARALAKARPTEPTPRVVLYALLRAR